MKTGLVITVGGTADPILKAIREIHQKNPGRDIVLVLLYGRPFPGQTPSPFDVAHKAKQQAEALGIDVCLCEVSDPEDIDRALEASREALHMVADADSVIVNFTGGTKVMSAAVVHAALTEPLGGKLILDYTGGKLRDAQGRVLREAMRVQRSERTATEEILQRVLDYLQRFSYRDARVLLHRLPERGRAGFVRKVTEALYQWDEFHYEDAVQYLRDLARAAHSLEDDSQIGWLARTVRRLLRPGHRIVQSLSRLRKAQEGQIPDAEAVEGMVLLVADALENGQRRIVEGRLTDSVLRSYRAVELAVQGRLLREGVNPWRPNWERLDENLRTSYREKFGTMQLPRELALSSGLTLLEALGQVQLDREQQKHLQDLQRTRNFSYLEHGFNRVEDAAARRVWQYAVTLSETIWGQSLEQHRASVQHLVQGDLS